MYQCIKHIYEYQSIEYILKFDVFGDLTVFTEGSRVRILNGPVWECEHIKTASDLGVLVTASELVHSTGKNTW